NLDGTFTVPSLGSIQRTGGIVNIVGTLNNAGTTLTLGAASGSWTLNGGTIRGGIVTTSNGARLAATSANSTLDGVTVNGELDLTSQNFSWVVVTNEIGRASCRERV